LLARNAVIVGKWLLVAGGFLACLLVLVGPRRVQATFKNTDDRLGRIEQTLNDMTRGGTVRSGPAPQTQGSNREPSETTSKFYLKTMRQTPFGGHYKRPKDRARD
jgi:hypothetical protein